jgi:hypothetical protein
MVDNAARKLKPEISSFLSNDEALKVITGAVIRANTDYAEMSGGLTLHDSGVEAYVSGRIACELCEAGRARGGKVYASLETSFEAIAEWSGATGSIGAKPVSLRKKGRVDVVYYDGDGDPAGIVEVKRHFSWSALRDDVDRITAILRRCGRKRSGSLRWGCVVGFHSDYEGSRKLIESRMESFTKRLAAEYPSVVSYCNISFENVPIGSRLTERKLKSFHAPGVLFELT